ncbi:hypothetical protein V8F33_004183 [Rhypophila sp. PSN 637]
MACHFVLSQHPGVERQFAVARPGASPSPFSLAAPMSMVVLSLLLSLLPTHWLRAFLCCPKGKVLFGTFPVLSARASLFVAMLPMYSPLEPGKEASTAIAYTRAPVASHVIGTQPAREGLPNDTKPPATRTGYW